MAKEAPDYTYWDMITDKIALDAFQHHDDSPDISIEKDTDNQSMDFFTYCLEYPEKFFRLLPALQLEYQEMLLEYYLLLKPQGWLARVHSRTQTVVWQEILASTQILASAILFQCIDLPESLIQNVLKRTKLEEVTLGDKQANTANLVAMYAKYRSFAYIANKLKVHRPLIRVAFRETVQKLLEYKDIKKKALSYYISGLIYRASPDGQGLSKGRIKKMKKLEEMRFSTPSIAGQFEVNVRDKNFNKLFSPKAMPR